jgi:hypothetical protein
MESKKCVKLGLELFFLLSGLSPLTGNPLKGKFHPIGPGTDAGLYNEGFFEGDIVPTMDVSINLYKPCVLYIGRAYRYPPDVVLYIYFSTNIST